uniref:CSON011114 protein n=1 Tax=Culicoides sonorensis TaxID=179676 RepID=A0A336N2D2_CULSO
MLRNIIRCVGLQGYNGIYSNLVANSARTLYTVQSLGLDGYESNRTRTKSMFSSTVDRFKEKMNNYSSEDSKNLVFSEDLKNIVHLAEKEDIPLVIKMLKKFATQNSELRFGSYVFGPVIMRMFYYLQDEETALQCFKDKSYDGIFDQWMSYQILCDMLYEKQRYQDILDVYDLIQERQIEGSMFPKHTIILVFGACYKMNTPESFKYATTLWKKMLSAGHSPMRRTVTFGAGLALAQNAPHIALEMLYNTKQQNYITVRNMKVLAMIELGRTDDVIPVLRSVLEAVGGSLTKQTFCAEILERVRAAVDKSDNKELKIDYDRIEKYLKENGHVSDQTINDLICMEIDTKSMPTNNMGNKNQTFINASFSRDNQNSRNRRPMSGRPQRPGLSEMY